MKTRIATLAIAAMIGFTCFTATPAFGADPQRFDYSPDFAAIAEACPLPAMIYNIPSRTGTNSTPDIIARVNSAYPHMRGVKEASGSIDQSSPQSARYPFSHASP